MGAAADFPRLSDIDRKPRAQNFTRAVKALAIAKGDYWNAATYAKAQWPEAPQIEVALRSAANAGSLGHVGSPTGWGQQLAASSFLSEFVELTRQASVIGRLANVHRVPFNIGVGVETASAVGAWVEGSPTPASELAFSNITLGIAKAGCIVALSRELAKAVGPTAELRIQQSIVKAVASFLDAQFLDPSVLSSTTHPGSIIAGATPVVTSGTTAAAVATDIVAVVDQLLTASGGELVSPILIMSPRLAARIALKRDTSGASAYPDVKFSGGSLMGIPVLVSNAASWSTSGGGRIILIDQDAVMLADDGGAQVDTSTEAALQMSDVPAEGATTQTSFFQNNLFGIRVIRAINWAPRRAGCASFIDSANY